MGFGKQHGQPAFGPAGRRSLRKPQPGCFELAASRIQEREERIYRGCCIQDVGVSPPSQLISRRPFSPRGPGLLRLLGSPDELGTHPL